MPFGCGDSAIGIENICHRDQPKSIFLFESFSGTGAETCYDGDGNRDYRAYCCGPFNTYSAWQDCQWMHEKQSDGFCEAYCPLGTVRLAMSDQKRIGEDDGCRQGFGGRAMCCVGSWMTPAANIGDIQQAMADAVVAIAAHPCNWTDPAVGGPAINNHSAIASTSAPQLAQGLDAAYVCRFAFDCLLIMMNSGDRNQVSLYEGGWNMAMTSLGLHNLPATRVEHEPSGLPFSQMHPAVATMHIQGFLNSFKSVNDMNPEDEDNLACNLAKLQPTSFPDPDDGGVDDGSWGSWDVSDLTTTNGSTDSTPSNASSGITASSTGGTTNPKRGGVADRASASRGMDVLLLRNEHGPPAREDHDAQRLEKRLPVGQPREYNIKASRMPNRGPSRAPGWQTLIARSSGLLEWP